MLVEIDCFVVNCLSSFVVGGPEMLVSWQRMNEKDGRKRLKLFKFGDANFGRLYFLS